MIEKSENITNLASALLKAQKDIGIAIKDAKNPYFKSSYADLKTVIDAVKEPLNNHGIAFLQMVNTNGGDMPVIETMLLHESGQYLLSNTPVFCAKPNDPQAFGSGVTYSKRYALQAILGLPTADDDAEGAMNRTNGKPKQQAAKAPEPSVSTKSTHLSGQSFITSKQSPQIILEDVTPVLEKAYEAFQQDFMAELPKGSIFSFQKWQQELKYAYKALSPAKKQVWKWDEEHVTELAKKVDPTKCMIAMQEEAA